MLWCCRTKANYRGSRAILCALLFEAMALSGCPMPGSPQQATTFSSLNKRAELLCPREGAERVDVGSWRGSGRPDVARIYVKPSDGHGGTVLTCREVDLNGDGHKDMLVFYEPDGKKQREEFDQDFDGVADIKSFYEQGHLVRQELDINHDGKADLVQHYEGGRLLRVEKILPSAEPAPSGSGDKPAAEKPATTEAAPNQPIPNQPVSNQRVPNQPAQDQPAQNQQPDKALPFITSP